MAQDVAMRTGAWTRAVVGIVVAAATITLGLPAPAGAARGDVTVKKDVAYRSVDGEQLALDVYQPAKKGKNRAAVVVVHGGGWTQGDKALFARQSDQLAQSGFVAFSVNYRLAPAHPFPAAVDDVEAAVAWVRKHARGYGVDPKRIGALGGSAGGHLVGMLATDGDGSLQAGHRVAAVVSWSGPMDLVALGPGAATNAGSSIRNFLGCLADACPDTYAAASPVTHVDKTDSPMLIVNSSNELVPKAQADAMKAALDKAGVATQEIILPGTAHSRAYSDQVWDQTVTFLENYLKA
jgi:acetyl esterase/lipase